jgi:hypothetical protein
MEAIAGAPGPAGSAAVGSQVTSMRPAANTTDSWPPMEA